MIYNVDIYYSKHGLSDAEQFEVLNNCSYGNGMNAKKKAIPPVPPPKKPR